MNRDELTKLLNEDLELEYRSIIEYVQHIATMKGAEYQATLAELESHLHQEVNHALTLARQIDFLGGTPSNAAPTFATETEAGPALKQDLALEEHQLERYRERISQAEESGLPDVAEVLAPLLEQTQDHVRELRVALG